MRKSKRESQLKKIALTALMLGILSPMAYAEEEAAPAPAAVNNGFSAEELASLAPMAKDGVNLAELKSVVRNLEFYKNGAEIQISGTMPARCVKDETGSSLIPTAPRYNAETAQHQIRIKLSDSCMKNPNWIAGDIEVDAAKVFGSLVLEDANGAIVLAYGVAGSAGSPSREKVEKLPLKDHESEETAKLNAKTAAQEAADAALAEQNARDRAEKLERLRDLKSDVEGLCKAGDFVGVNEVLLAAADDFEDVSEFLARAKKVQMAQLEKALDKAETAEDALAAYEAYDMAALEQGVEDAGAVKKKYIQKRFDLLNILASDAGVEKAKLDELDRAARDWKLELGSLDRKEYNDRLNFFASLYYKVGNTLARTKEREEDAVAYYDKAKEFTDDEGKMNLDKQAGKVYRKMFEACLAKNPGNMGTCDTYRDLAKARATSIGETLAAMGASDDKIKGFSAEYIQQFGSGFSVNHPLVGQISSQGGEFDVMKEKGYQQYMQEKMMQQMYGVRAPATSGTSFLK